MALVGGIPPFNFPIIVPSSIFPMPIPLRNTFILNPSQPTPLFTQNLLQLFQKPPLPKPLFNLL
ncbi:aldehyde dehydrogenase family protein, partial [Bacillus licheniformis]|uniref:aldehyde dehydrogenase family protein n=1 Tax=Bacillus licheniformis TaxID=1402 RepID=UPI003C12C45D